MIVMMHIQIKNIEYGYYYMIMLIIMDSNYQDKEDDFLDEKNLKNYNWKQKLLYYYLKPFSFLYNLYDSITSFESKIQIIKKLINLF